MRYNNDNPNEIADRLIIEFRKKNAKLRLTKSLVFERFPHSDFCITYAKLNRSINRSMERVIDDLKSTIVNYNYVLAGLGDRVCGDAVDQLIAEE